MALAVAAPGPVLSAEPAAPKATLEGRILDQQGLAVPGASVILLRADSATASAISDAEGNFRLQSAPGA